MKRVRLLPWSSVESQASHIQDPIMRLRFLKLCARHSPDPIPAPAWTRAKSVPAICFVLLLAGLLAPGYQASNRDNATEKPVPQFHPASADTFPKVWLVDKSQDFETYSNGLRIDDRYAVANEAACFIRCTARDAVDPDQPEWRSEPAGIVYHTTESDQARFRPGPEREAEAHRQGRC